jgi:hypothetical protein
MKIETTTQLAIKAYRLRKSTLGLTYDLVSKQMQCSVRSIVQVNTLCNLMETHNSKENNFDSEKVLETLLDGKACSPDMFPWLTKEEKTISGILEAFKRHLVKIKALESKDKDSNISSVKECKEVIKELKKEIDELKAKLKLSQ